MKRILLGISIYFAAVVGGFAQHTQTATGFSNTCDEIGSSSVAWEFTNYFTSGGGGYDNSKVDTLKFSYGMNASSTGYYIFFLTNTVDLTAPNNTLQFSISATGATGNDTSIVANVGLEDAANNHLTDPHSITMTRAYSNQNITLTVASGQVLTAVKKVVITLDNSSVGSVRNGSISITKLKAGSSVTATKDAAANIASSKLYPNPTSDMARVELNLKSASSVKVVVSDLMGKEVMTVAEGTYSELAKDFSVAGLNRGMYSVNYYINGSAAKAEMLMVK